MAQDMGWVFAAIERLSGDDLSFFRCGQIGKDQIHRCIVSAVMRSWGRSQFAFKTVVRPLTP